MDSRPDLSREPYPAHRPQPHSAYLHVLVVEAESSRHPTPENSKTAIYTVPILPAAPLEVGQYVHLHRLCVNALPGEAQRSLEGAVALPTPIAGIIEAERMRTEGELELILKNEVAEAKVKNAIIRIRHIPSVSARAGSASVLLDKLERLKADREGRKRPERVTHPTYPRGAESRDGPVAQDLKWRTPLDAESPLLTIIDQDDSRSVYLIMVCSNTRPNPDLWALDSHFSA